MSDSLDIENTNFPLTIKKTLQSYKYDNNVFLKYHQFIVYNYLIKYNKRGILLYHEMGMGKSITSIALSEFYRKQDKTRNIIVLLPKSLQNNYIKNIKMFIKKNNIDEYKNINNVLKNRYNFVSLNSSKMFDNIKKIDDNDEIKNLDLDESIKNLLSSSKKNSLENSLLIIDEYHNFSNSIVNGSSNAIKLYNLIMNTKDIKLIFLTGTPVINTPFELVPTFNMLKGYFGFKKTTLFPEYYHIFKDYFINEKDKIIKNSDKFKNRITGLCSYYGNKHLDKNNDDYPDELETIVEYINMSEEQFSRYEESRDIEKKETTHKYKTQSNSQDKFKSTNSSSSYRIRSRQVSNFLIPEYALERKGKKINKHPEKISDEDLSNLNTFSPKYKKLLENLSKYEDKLGMVYSSFVTGEGINLLGKVLSLNGYTNHKDNNVNKDSKCYAIISGETDIDERQTIINIFNSKENITGSLINLLLVSKSGAEGIDLKNIRHIHIMEPYWNWARIEQIIARGVRYKSHEDLEKKERNVQPYIYLSTYPMDYDKKDITEETTDVDIYNNSKDNKKIIDTFLLSLIESSIDCSIHKDNNKNSINCNLCLPDNNIMYTDNIDLDMKTLNPCKKYKLKEVKANEIEYLNKTYYYIIDKKNNYKIFYYDSDLNEYIEIKVSEPIYSDLLTQIIQLV